MDLPPPIDYFSAMKLTGTGSSPSALRNTAQCIASTPTMLAASPANRGELNRATVAKVALAAPLSSVAA